MFSRVLLFVAAAVGWAFSRSRRGRQTALFHPQRLPGAEDARADDAKFTEYLLNPDHLDGRSKAALFNRIGFTADNWRELRDLIVSTVPHVEGRLRKENRSGGENWEAVMRVEGPTGTVVLRTFWEVRPGEVPKFLTAYPTR